MTLRFASTAAFVVACAACTWIAGCINAVDCRKMDVNGYSTSCSGPAGYVWSGTACIYTRSCNCTGDDCRSMYTTQELCESAHAMCTP